MDTVPIKVGKNAGKHPAIASLYRPSPKPRKPAHPPTPTSSARAGPAPARITGAGSGTSAESMERFARQVLDGDRVPDDLAWQAENGSDDVMVRLLAQTRDGNAE
ncbi:hypothetical protein ACIBSV_11480 [Embleya sp. NPDC050154]|uniref:hypothetical protein n=1 Tax=unclassified Embleya TaxID=2699296 RepID=UPI003792C887